MEGRLRSMSVSCEGEILVQAIGRCVSHWVVILCQEYEQASDTVANSNTNESLAE